MTRPIALITSTNYQVNLNAIKMLIKTNTDFFVVGCIGMQGVGKSTIMNLLATNNFQSYKQIFNDEKDGIFPTKFKSGKFTTLPKTESVHMFITKDRMILLDCPPVLSNPYKRDALTNELEDIKLLILLLTVCHLIIVVQDQYFNSNFIRLLQFAEITKLNNDIKPFISDYLSNILFIKNRGMHFDFLDDEQQRMEKMYKYCFKKSKLNIYLENYDEDDDNDDKSKNLKQFDNDRRLNYFVFPQITGNLLNMNVLIIRYFYLF